MTITDEQAERACDTTYALMRNAIGNAVRRYRLQHEMTQAEMATLLRCSVAQISLVEDLRRLDYNPRLTTVADVCRALGVLPHELFADPMT